MAHILNTVVREGVEMVAVTLDTGSVKTIGPVHPSYKRIRQLCVSRADDDLLYELITTRRDTAPESRRLLDPAQSDNHLAQELTTNDTHVWFAGNEESTIHPALADEILFLASISPQNKRITKTFESLISFAYKLLGADKKIQNDLVKFYFNGMIGIRTHGQIPIENQNTIRKYPIRAIDIEPDVSYTLIDPASITGIARIPRLTFYA